MITKPAAVPLIDNASLIGAQRLIGEMRGALPADFSGDDVCRVLTAASASIQTVMIAALQELDVAAPVGVDQVASLTYSAVVGLAFFAAGDVRPQALIDIIGDATAEGIKLATLSRGGDMTWSN